MIKKTGNEPEKVVKVKMFEFQHLQCKLFLDRNKLDLTLLKNSRKFQWTQELHHGCFSSLLKLSVSISPPCHLWLLSHSAQGCADKAVGYAGVS